MRSRSRAVPFVLCLPLVWAASTESVASAQTLPSIDARTWRPSTDPSAGLVLEPTTTAGAWNWNVGAFLSYSYRPVSLTLNDPTLGNIQLHPVESLLGLDLVAGLGLGSRVSIGASLPTALYQTGTNPSPTTVSSSGELPQTAIGDLALNGKATLIDDSGGGFGLAALGTVTIPTGDPESFMGEGSVTVGARLIAEYTLLVATLQGSLGYTLRTDQRTWPDPSVGGIVYGDSIPWSVVFAMKPAVLKLDKDHRQRWELGAHGWVPAGPVAPFVGAGASQLSPALLSLADRIEIGHYREAYFLAGAEVGLNPNATGTPVFRGILGFGWSPRNHDMDNDSVPDDVDQCPELPEDKDGFEDSDGCPEIDNDDDGVLDKDDACPNVPGSPSTDPKKNGCPQPDRDKDGVPDDVDACPDQKGIETDDPKTNGCPKSGDRDKDGIPDRADRCPDQPEDKDGVEDDDGCPDPDNDGDGIADIQDACPTVPGEASSDPKTNGCPNPDRDGDTFDNDVDKCPDEPETFNGVKDDDGCPDTGGKALVVVVEGPPPRLKLGNAGDKLAIDGATVRAIVLEANRHRDWTFLVAVNAAKPEASLGRAGALADDLDKLAHREVAEATAWDSVKKEPATTGDVKIVVVVRGKEENKEAAPPPLPPVPKP